ncbi:MAG: aldehyde-activating protein [Caulobacter sp.]|nr:aldehyde-activating protein [Caulobacter sp.]
MTLVLPLTGGCACGQIRYAVTAQPFMVTACHCTVCQRRTGSAYSMNMMTPKDGFEITQGETMTRENAGVSGRVGRQHFCPNCLIRTHTEPLGIADLIFVRPGTLDDPQAVAPIAQIFTAYGRPEALLDGVAAFEEGLPDFMPYVEKWRAAHPVAP